VVFVLKSGSGYRARLYRASSNLTFLCSTSQSSRTSMSQLNHFLYPLPFPLSFPSLEPRTSILIPLQYQLTTVRGSTTPLMKERLTRGLLVTPLHPLQFPPYLRYVLRDLSPRKFLISKHSQPHLLLQLQPLTGSRYHKGVTITDPSNLTSNGLSTFFSARRTIRESTWEMCSARISVVSMVGMTRYLLVVQESSHVGYWWASRA
jgi:hypothetical protein